MKKYITIKDLVKDNFIEEEKGTETMIRRSILNYKLLEAEIKGYKVFSRGEGRITLHRSSSLSRSISACLEAHPTADVTYLVGGDSGNRGKEWCVVYRPLPVFQEAPGKASGLFAESENVVTSEENACVSPYLVQTRRAEDEKEGGD